MKHLWFLGTLGAVGGILFYLNGVSIRSAEADPLDAVLMLSPAPAAIHQEIAARAADTPPMSLKQRQDLFAQRFTERFREHESKIAIRARFEEVDHAGSRIKLMCPARMEPWNMDRVALSAWREAQDCLGQVYDLDLYETYIGSSPHKVGELRVTRSPAPLVYPIAHIRYLTRSQAAEAAAASPVRRRPAGLFGAFPRRPFVPTAMSAIPVQR